MCRNKEELLRIPERQLRSRAKEHFLHMSGFSDKNPPSSFQMEEIKEVADFIKNQIDVRIFVKKVDNYSFHEKNMWIEQKKIYYTLPIYRFKEKIHGLVLFFVTEKEIFTEGKRVMEQLYTQIWQNAYLDAAREWLKEWLMEREHCFVSQCVAPGFYGIDVKEVKTFGHLLQSQRFGVTVDENGYIKPEKTVMGMYFLLQHDLNIFGKRCETCLAQGKNCEFCMDKL